MPSDVWVTIAVALLGSGALTAVLTPLANRRINRTALEKSRIDGAKVLTDAAVQLLKPLQEQVDEAAARMVEANRSIERLGVELAQSREQVTRLGRDLAESRDQVTKLTVYIEQLVSVIRDAGLPVPPNPVGPIT